MSREDFSVWAEGAAAKRDAAIKKMDMTTDAVLRTQLVEQLNDR